MKTIDNSKREELIALEGRNLIVAHYMQMWGRGECTLAYALAETTLALAEQNDALFRWVVEGAGRLRPDTVVDTRKEGS